MSTKHRTVVQAAIAGDLADIAKHVANGESPNKVYQVAPGEYVSTLTLTASQGPAPAVESLLKFGALPDGDAAGQGGSPLAAAIIKGRKDVVEVLLDHGADPNKVDGRGETSLHVAAHVGRDDIYKLLVENGGDEHMAGPDGFTPLQVRAFVTVKARI